MFSDVVGQDLNKKLLKAILRAPDTAPRTLIFEGAFGCGKTSLARIFARALNCENPNHGEPCGKCSMCVEPIDSSPFYVEYDSTIIGNVETMRAQRDTFQFPPPLGLYRVVVFDEAHTVSVPAQNALLKTIEEVTERIFYIFCTTEVSKIIKTIQSRSLELSFQTVRSDDLIPSLKELSEKLEIEISDEMLVKIARISGGHVRSAHMLLDKYCLLGAEEFKNSSLEPYPVFPAFFTANEKARIEELLTILTDFPLSHLQRDFNRFLYALSRGFAENSLKDSLKPIAIRLVKMGCEPWVQNAFVNDYTFRAAMLALRSSLESRTASTTVASTSPDSTSSVYAAAVKKS